MIDYIIQVLLFQILFTLCYDLFLSKETFFSSNRWYLLGATIFSFCLPFINVSLFKKTSNEYLVLVPEVIISPQKVIEASTWYQEINYVSLIFWMVSILFLGLFIHKLSTIFRLITNNKKIKKDSYTLVLINGKTKAFSFFNYIFIGTGIAKDQQQQIIHHELIHSKQKHSLDLLFFEFLKIFMWFNPMIYILQHRISLVHEYISDAEVSKLSSKKAYINNLLSDIFQVASISFINQFYKHSLIKKRIIMMTKKQSENRKQLKYLVLVPAVLGMLFYVSCNNTDTKVSSPSSSEKMVEPKENLPILSNEKVSFASLEKIPTFPDCPDGDKGCFNKTMISFVQKHFDVKHANTLNLPVGKKRIYASFIISNTGEVKDIKARAPHATLKEHAESIISKLPRMKAGEKNGKRVNVHYTLPITFVVE
ncbi:BlaR1 peptidase M56 [Tenacibaculum sp. 190524A02b]|uniref:M56 family metallopeptidase n=1 Tax=Tenacibaculum vairaonense TaxID=3137860 RepID=UPI0032B1D60F